MFVGIDTAETVYIRAHRAEMGTGIRTSLALVVAAELDADWKRHSRARTMSPIQRVIPATASPAT